MSAQETVNEALENGVENDYELHDKRPLEIAVDLVYCVKDLELFEPTHLAPYVKQWLANNDKTIG